MTKDGNNSRRTSWKNKHKKGKSEGCGRQHTFEVANVFRAPVHDTLAFSTPPWLCGRLPRHLSYFSQTQTKGGTLHQPFSPSDDHRFTPITDEMGYTCQPKTGSMFTPPYEGRATCSFSTAPLALPHPRLTHIVRIIPSCMHDQSPITPQRRSMTPRLRHPCVHQRSTNVALASAALVFSHLGSIWVGG